MGPAKSTSAFKRRVGIACASGALIVFVAAARGQPTSSEADRRAANESRVEQAAKSAAHTGLTRRVLALAVDRERTVGDLLVGDLSKDRALRRWVRATPVVETRHAEGSCEVLVRLPAAAVRERLRVLFERTVEPDEDPNRSEEIDWDAAARAWGDIEETGRATNETANGAPIGWENVPEPIRALTRRAAEADARRALLDAASRLRVTQARGVSEFLAAGDAVRREVMRGIDAAATVTTRLEPDQVAVGEARISSAELIRILVEVHGAHYRGDLFRVEHFREMALLVRDAEISASGYAVPPPSERVAPPSLADSSQAVIAGATSEAARAGGEVTRAGDAPRAEEAAGQRDRPPPGDDVAVVDAALSAESQSDGSGEAALRPAASEAARATSAPPDEPSRDQSPGAPAWAAQTLRVVGHGGPASDPAQGLEFARRAAVRALRDRALELEVERDLSIGAVLGYRDDLRPAFETALGGAVQVGNPVRRADGGLDLTMELSLRCVWSAIRPDEAATPYATDEDTRPDGDELPPATRPATQPASRRGMTARE